MLIKKIFNKIVSAFIVISFLTLIYYLFISVWEGPFGSFSKYNVLRLSWTFSLVMGYPVYPDPSSSVLLARLYGPLSPLVYLPSTLANSYETAIYIGSAISATLYFTPPVLIYLSALKGLKPLRIYYFLPLSMFAFLSFNYECLNYTAFCVHADALALGLGLLAAGCIYLAKESNKSIMFFLSALFAVFAIWTKYITCFMFLGLCLYVFMAYDKRDVKKYLSFSLLNFLVLSGVFALVFDLKNMFFEMILIPKAHHLDFNLYLSEIIFLLSCAVFLLLLVVLSVYYFRHKSKRGLISIFLKRNNWFVFIFIALCMLPGAFLGRIKVRGDINNYSYIIYYLFFGFALGHLRFFILTNSANVSKHLKKERIITLSFIGLFFLFMLSVPINIKRIYNILDREHDLFKQAYTMIKNNKGYIYFPDLPLLHIYAEGKLYHSTDGICDRRIAGYSITDEQLKAFIPDKLRYIGMISNNKDNHYNLLLNQFKNFRAKNAYIFPNWVMYLKNSFNEKPVIDEKYRNIAYEN